MAHLYDGTSPLPRPTHFNFATSVVDHWATRDPSQLALQHIAQDGRTESKLTYAHFARESRTIAVLLLRDLGLVPGDVVVLILPRVPAWWAVATACLRAGVVFCPCTTLLVEKDIEYRVRVSGARAFIGDKVAVRKCLSVRRGCAGLERVVQVGGEAPRGVVDFHASLERVKGEMGSEKGSYEVEEEKKEEKQTKASDPAILFFTSGTSGPPKIVRHSHISYPLAHVLTGRHWLDLQPGKVYWNLSEQGWAKAAWSFFGAWTNGACLFVVDDRGPFSPIRVLETLNRYPVTTLCAPPTAYRQMVLDESQRYIEANKPKALEHCVGAGEPLNGSVIDTWKRMTGLEIRDGYGQTETILLCANQEPAPVKPGSMGKPLPGVPLYVIDDDGKETSKEDQEGDIAVRLDDLEGTQNDSYFGIFDGYLEEGKLDRRIRNLSGHNWYLTGDRATRDRDGYLWFVGRGDDVINSSGYRIGQYLCDFGDTRLTSAGPFEVESTLKQHPAVVESAVVASPDPQRDEVVKAFVVLTEQAAKSADKAQLKQELQAFCKANAAPYKYPRKIEFVDASFLPKTISGKIKRGELKKMEKDKYQKEQRAKL